MGLSRVYCSPRRRIREISHGLVRSKTGKATLAMLEYHSVSLSCCVAVNHPHCGMNERKLNVVTIRRVTTVITTVTGMRLHLTMCQRKTTESSFSCASRSSQSWSLSKFRRR